MKRKNLETPMLRSQNAHGGRKLSTNSIPIQQNHQKTHSRHLGNTFNQGQGEHFRNEQQKKINQ